MNWFARSLSVTLLVNLFTLSPASASCSCGPAQEIDQAYTDAQTVFIGRVEHILKSPLRQGLNEIKFLLMKGFKGTEEAMNRTLVVYTPIESDECGYAFIPGQEYLVYASGTPANFRVVSCSRTKVYDTAKEEVTKLVVLSEKPAH